MFHKFPGFFFENNSENGIPVLIFYLRKAYDVSGSFLWKKGNKTFY